MDRRRLAADGVVECKGAIEERARSELGMIRQDEIFFQLPPDAQQPAPAIKPQRVR